MSSRLLHTILLVVLSAFVGYYVGVSKVSFDWKHYKPVVNIVNKEPPAAITNINFDLLWTVLGKVETDYYDKNAVNPQKLLNGAITGMVQSIGDPYTLYLPSQQNSDFKQGMSGEFQGIGAELGLKDNHITVVSPLDGTPAQKAGIKAGDQIIKVNAESTTGWGLAQAVQKIRGPKGSSVVLTVIHKDETKPVDITITRGTITVKSVEGGVKNISDIKSITIPNDSGKGGSGTKQTDQNGKTISAATPTDASGVPLLGTKDRQVVYIRLSQFGDKTNDEWVAIVNKVVVQMKKDGSNIKGLVLDLRNNPGGYLTDASFIASEFLKDGVIVVQDSGNGQPTPFSVNRAGLLTDIPMIVLINKGSASASEIVAGALRDHNRAKIIGETSFGKGTIQEAQDLGNGAGIHITIARWLTPNGTWVHGKGLTPDIIVKLDPKNPTHDTQLERVVQELIK